jgi:hypothetical protein
MSKAKSEKLVLYEPKVKIMLSGLRHLAGPDEPGALQGALPDGPGRVRPPPATLRAELIDS